MNSNEQLEITQVETIVEKTTTLIDKYLEVFEKLNSKCIEYSEFYERNVLDSKYDAYILKKKMIDTYAKAVNDEI